MFEKDMLHALIGELRVRFPDFDSADIDEVVLGIVSPVGEQGAVISRAVALVAGLPESVPGTQINRFCASGLEATNLVPLNIRSASSRSQLIASFLAGGIQRVPILFVSCRPTLPFGTEAPPVPAPEQPWRPSH